MIEYNIVGSERQFDWFDSHVVDGLLYDIEMVSDAVKYIEEASDKIYVHPDSYHIFEPQVGDVMATVRPDSTSAEFLVTDARAKEYEHLMTKQYPAKIIQETVNHFLHQKFLLIATYQRNL